MARQRAKTMAMTVADSEGVEQGEVLSVSVGPGARATAARTFSGRATPSMTGSASGPLAGFPSNRVVTSKYTVLNFLPKFLFEAYHHASNVYFTFDLAVQLIPGVTPIPPITTALPLVFVLGVSALREALEDYARHKADEATNSATTEVLRDGVFKEVHTQDISVGDVIRVKNEQEFPADIILISSSTPQGVCYDMTANLDGETNLKLHRCPPATAAVVHDAASAWGLEASYQYELPNARIHQFNGSLKVDGTLHSLDTQHLLLRGAQLRNTDWVLGLVAYSGRDTKLSRNQHPPPSRMSVMEHRLNVYVMFMFVLQFVSIVLMTSLSVAWSESHVDEKWYLGGEEFSSPVVLWFRNYGTWFILLALYIPISLFVTLEVVRFIQALFMRWDRLDTPELTASLPWGEGVGGEGKGTVLRLMTHVGGIKPRTSSLNEDLGCIEYVFSDKTGTLTRNKMRFAHAYVACGQVFNEAASPGSMAAGAAHAAPADALVITRFLRILAVCHTAVPERIGEEGTLVYNTESTDELALVTAASDNGLQLVGRSLDAMVIRETSPSGAGAGAGAGVGNGTGAGTGVAAEDGEKPEVSFELLAVLEFSSARRRMSVVVRTPEGRIMLYSKGADLVMFERMAAGQDELHARFETMLDQWSGEGLRTLVMGARELSQEEYALWKQRYDAANASINNRQALVADAANELERNLQLVGATAIEDQLQDNVPDTIAYLREAGVKVWVLTGDKRSTAISVAYSCRLVTPRTTLIKMQVTSKEEAAAALDGGLMQVETGIAPIAAPSSSGPRPLSTVMEAPDDDTDSRPGMSQDRTSLSGNGWKASPMSRSGDKRGSQRLPSSADDDSAVSKYCLVLDGRSLVHLLHRSNGNRAKFFKLIEGCESVIVCRATPLQKADVVAAVQNELGRITLAIGDGANDVSMIQKAHVGVGVLGREGTQAARSADYAISQFQHLRRLMAIHGRYSYIRLSKLIKYSFYKNLAFTIMPLWFGFSSAFAGQTLHDAWIMTCYNMIYTSLPPLMHGLFEKDIDEETILAHPKTYRYTQQRSPFKFWVYAVWLLNGLVHSVIIYFGVQLAFGGQTFENGKTPGFWGLSSMASTVCVVVVLLKAALITNHWTVFNHIVTWGSAVVYILTMWMYTASGMNPDVNGVWADVIMTPRALLCIPVIAAAALTPDFAVAAYMRWNKPHDWEILREQTRLASKEGTQLMVRSSGLE